MTTMKRAALALAVAMAGLLHATDWWVDSMGSGDGTTPATPMAGVQAAIDASTAGDTIHIRGGEGRVYTNTAYTVSKRLTLQDWEAKPIFRITNATDVISSRVVNIAAGGVTLRNLRFEIRGGAIGAGDDIVEITNEGGAAAHNILLEGCEFVMTAFGAIWSGGQPVFQNTTPYGTNFQVRSCLFKDWDLDGDTGDGYRIPMVTVNGDYGQVVDNTFTNTSRILSGVSRYARVSGNRIINCRTRYKFRSNINYGAMIITGYNGLRDCEISHNIVWNNNGRSTDFLGKVREGFTGNTRIFNNTVYNAESLAGASYYTASPGTTQWQPKIYNNLLINNVYTNIYGIGTNTLGVLTSTFLPASEIKNNLWYGGANTLDDPASVGITPVDCYNVACTFVTTTDTASPDFLRPDGNATPQVLLGFGGSYPTYIGALEPLRGQPATLILVR